MSAPSNCSLEYMTLSPGAGLGTANIQQTLRMQCSLKGPEDSALLSQCGRLRPLSSVVSSFGLQISESATLLIVWRRKVCPSPHNAACVLCLSQPESAMHLLATCTISIRLWRRILNSANLPASLAPNIRTLQLQDWLEETRRALPLANRKAWTSLGGTSGRSGTPGFSGTLLLASAVSMLLSSKKQRVGEMQEGARPLTCYIEH
jgi:hypothetical protein